MEEDRTNEEVAEGSAVRSYAAINLRARAFLIDAIVVGGGIMLLVVLSTFLEEVPGFGRVFIVVLWALLIFYEPVFVSTRGATIGHRRANIEVVSDATGGPPRFTTAFGRFLVKAILGFPSFLGMAFTRRHQAIHDVLTGTTVQIHDPSLARDYDVVLERSSEPTPTDTPEAVSWKRKLLVTLAYLGGAFVAFNVAATALVSRGCRETSDCSSIDRSNSGFVLVLFLIAFALIIVLGWKARLPGARRQQLEPPPG